MSFILDALRKSESRRKAGEIPRLDSESDAPVAPRRRGRRVLVGFVILPVLAVTLAAGIYLVRPDWVPTSVTSVFDTEPTAGDPTPELEQVATVDFDRDHDPDAGARETEAPAIAELDEPDDGPVDEEEQAEEEATSETSERRRILRADPERTVRREAPQRERIVSVEEATEEIERELGRAPTRHEEIDETPVDPEPPVTERTEPPADVEVAADETEPETTADEPWRSQAAEYVRAWELPLSVRRELPDLKLTIHVFSPQKEGRFVLINGERYVPGDALGGGAELVDIRREGAVVDFREHRFLLEP